MRSSATECEERVRSPLRFSHGHSRAHELDYGHGAMNRAPSRKSVTAEIDDVTKLGDQCHGQFLRKMRRQGTTQNQVTNCCAKHGRCFEITTNVPAASPTLTQLQICVREGLNQRELSTSLCWLERRLKKAWRHAEYMRTSWAT